MASYRIRWIRTDGSYGPWGKVLRITSQEVISRAEHDISVLYILGVQVQRFAVNGRRVEGEDPITILIAPDRLQDILDNSLKSWLPRVKKAYAALLAAQQIGN